MKPAGLCRRAGFSLAETALSLAIVGLVITAMVPTLISIRAAQGAQATQAALQSVARAAAAFAQANGCFPCPSPASVVGASGFGLVRGDTSNTSACNGCPTPVGMVPFRSLGLPQSYARDGYGRYLTFAVDPALTASNLSTVACTVVDSDCTNDDITHSAHKKGLCKTGLDASNRIQVYLPAGSSQQAALLVMSHGANGTGAFAEKGAGSTRMALPATACSLGNSGAERCNASGTQNFFNAAPSAGADPFDDQLLYFDRNALMASLGGPGCQAQW